MYRLSTAGTTVTSCATADEQTLAQAIAPGDQEVAVTFSAECADEFPSVQHLAPGNPLLDQIVAVYRDATDDETRYRKELQLRPNESRIPLACVWGQDATFGRVSAAGAIIDAGVLADLPDWCTQFLETRDKATNA